MTGKKFIITFLLFVIHLSFYTQIEDSTLIKINNVTSVDKKVSIILKDGWVVLTKDPNKALSYVEFALKDSGKIESILLLDSLYRLKAFCYGDMNNRSEALSSHLTRLKVLSNIDENTRSHYAAYFEVAGVLSGQGNEELSRAYYLKSFEIAKKLENQIPLAEILLTVADYKIEEGKIDTALIYLHQSRKIFSKIERLSFIMGTIDLKIARIHKEKGENNKVLERVKSALLYADTLSFVEYNILTYKDAGELFLYCDKPNEAIHVLKIAERLGVKNNKFFYLPKIYKLLSLAYKNSNLDKAYNYLIKYNELNDSVINVANNEKIAELRFEYEDERKKLQISNLEKDKAIAETENAKQSQFIKTISIALIMVLILLTFLIFLIKKIRSTNQLLNAQKTKILERNKEISDSIIYAKRIQEAVLPPKERYESLFPNSFIIYYPKDNLSGDFYWTYNVTANQNQKLKLFALGDCTGHGVPGALLSILGINYLNLGAVDRNINSPGQALDFLNNGICNTFGYSKNLIRDGMDIVIGAIDENENKLYYSCAKNPIYIVRENQLFTLKGDPKAIGNDDKDEHFKFSDFTFDLQQGDMIYCASDGIQDQFGGEKGKKYKVANLKLLLTRISNYSTSEQKALIENEFKSWSAGYEQVDDATIIGIRYK